MNKNRDDITGLGFDKVYETSKDFVKDLLKRCPNAAVVNPDLCNNKLDKENRSED